MAKRFLIAFIGLFLAAITLQAQDISLYQRERGEGYTLCEIDSFPKWEPHVMMGTGFVGTNYGDNRIYNTFAPSLVYRPNSRLTLTGGFALMTDLGLNSNYRPASVRSKAPRRSNGGTGLVSAGLEAQYQLGENLWIAASLYHMSGQYAPMYGCANGNVLDMSVTAFSTSMAYRFSNDNYLHLYVSFIRDNAGTMPYLLYDSFCNGWGGLSAYGRPFGHYSMLSVWDRNFGWYY